MSKEMKEKALKIALNCVRNTSFLEELHSGVVPGTKTGDYSDVKVVSPFGEIPWTEVNRFNNAEMKKLMIEVVDNVYSFFLYEEQLTKNPRLIAPTDWNEPQVNEVFARIANNIKLDKK